MKYCWVLIFLFSIGLVNGQNTKSKETDLVDDLQRSKAGQGKVTIFQDQGIDFLLETQTEINARSNGVEGYRIQIFKGSGPDGKRQALIVKGEFLSNFPDEEVHLDYSSPFWRVKVGDYRHRHEALLLLKKLQRSYPNCYIVKDGTVKMEKLK